MVTHNGFGVPLIWWSTRRVLCRPWGFQTWDAGKNYWCINWRAREPGFYAWLFKRENNTFVDKATSNICTAQVLLAVMARYVCCLSRTGRIKTYRRTGSSQYSSSFRSADPAWLYCIEQDVFWHASYRCRWIDNKNPSAGRVTKINLRYTDKNKIVVSLDETTDADEMSRLLSFFLCKGKAAPSWSSRTNGIIADSSFSRTSPILTHPVFNQHHSETEMLRYITGLENKDLSLNHSMIALACTMKLNATSEMVPG